MHRLILLLGTACLLSVSAGTGACGAKPKESVVILCASSVGGAMEELVETYQKSHPEANLAVSVAGTRVLREQIERGAPAHLFVSASPDHLDYLQHKGFIADSFDLLENQLVAIAPSLGIEFEPPIDPSDLGHEGLRVALGSPGVPVGDYAREALKELGLFYGLAEVISFSDEQSVVHSVETRAVDWGVAYLSSTVGTKKGKVRILANFPRELHSRIVVSVAVLKDAGDDARAFAQYLRSDEASAVFTREGFKVLVDDE